MRGAEAGTKGVPYGFIKGVWGSAVLGSAG